MKSELCKSCVHTKVCCKDKNLFGDIFLMGNPLFCDNHKRFEQYEERAAKGFPCDDYMPERKTGKWERVSHKKCFGYRCSICSAIYNRRKKRLNYCPNCGVRMVTDDGV